MKDAREYSEKFDLFFKTYDQVAPYVGLENTARTYFESKRNWCDKLKEPEFPVAFLGTFSAGKSTLINAIIGREILPEATESETAIPTYIRKGNQDKIVIHYLDEAAKVSLRNLYIDEIQRALQPDEQNDFGSREEFLKSVNLKEYIDSLEKMIPKLEKYNKNTINMQSLTDLKKLSGMWGVVKTPREERKLSETHLSQFVTKKNDYILLVDKVEVYLSDIDIPEDVVLVDLPGLGVVNPRHRKITEEFVEKKAKAFVVCMMPKKLLEGDEIKLLERINKRNPNILKRAFWVINQWETLTELQRKEEIANFEKRTIQYRFDISQDRCFKTSALLSLMLICLANGTMEKTQKLKSHLKDFEQLMKLSPGGAKEMLSKDRYTKPFLDFKGKLFDYLRTNAYGEFLNDARSSLSELVRNLLNDLHTMHGSSITNSRTVLIGENAKRITGDFIATITEIIKENAKRMRTEEIDEIVFWDFAENQEIQEQIIQSIAQIDRRTLANDLSKGMDMQLNLSRLPQKVEEKIKISQKLREKLAEVVRLNVFQKFTSSLRKSLLEQEGEAYLPVELQKSIKSKLSWQALNLRFKGVSDYLFYDYGDEIDEIGLTLKDSVKKTENKSKKIPPSQKTKVRDESLNQVLIKYQKGLCEYIAELGGDVRKYSNRSVKNYVEELEEDLLNLLDKEQDKIFKQITVILDSSSDMDSEIDAEVKKQEAIRNASETLKRLN